MSGRRVHERFACQIDVAFVVDGERFDARTDNMSLGGMHLVGDARPAFGAVGELTFRVPGMKADTVCQGTVRWNRPDGYGVQFGSLRPIDVWGLNQHFKKLSPIIG